eukprot:TRINITY_DN3475_c0_g3_i1.p1 TRINITY_DN3475_c0_g3~~TRINITY_DN3475_c0_g3_i1.p1  ORF type:complete len:238 (+),score=59.32 TRINITY_DN3475_c0_g3_i1:66-779(+)
MLAPLLLLGAAASAQNATQHACWKNTVARGVGKPITVCADGLEQDGLLCYPSCRAGYAGVGPVCWQTCPKGYTDDGATCRIPLQIIGADNSHCPWYDKCGLTLDKGCSTCPEGYTNDGCTCRVPLKIVGKDSYGRGAGVPLTCAKGLEEDAALCYKPCPSKDYEGVGPVCWEQCPAGWQVKCGAMCGEPGFSCSKEITDFITAALKEVVACSAGFSKDCIMGIAELAKLFALDGLCP